MGTVQNFPYEVLSDEQYCQIAKNPKNITNKTFIIKLETFLKKNEVIDKLYNLFTEEELTNIAKYINLGKNTEFTKKLIKINNTLDVSKFNSNSINWKTVLKELTISELLSFISQKKNWMFYYEDLNEIISNDKMIDDIMKFIKEEDNSAIVYKQIDLLLDLSLDFFCRSNGINIIELQNVNKKTNFFGNFQHLFSNENSSQKNIVKEFKETIHCLKETIKCMAANKAHSIYLKKNMEKIILSHPLLNEINNYLLALESLDHNKCIWIH